ncbi:MAG: AtpZ/AtpI family protein [Caulobacter sp.]|nr:AtpZ/AtpI family protein [Caulobacter sp.]
MPRADETREEALRRLDERAAALRASTQRAPHASAGEAAVGQAWRIIAELLGGVLIGLAAGAIADRFLGTGPWGTIGGVLGGFVLSLFLAYGTAQRLMARAKAEQEATPLPVVDVEDDEV